MNELQQLPVAKIKTLSNIRRKLGDLTELTASVKEVGILEPLSVRPNGDGWIVLFGHRRLAAATAAGLKEVPAIVRTDLTDGALVAAQLIENLVRLDIDPLEEAEGYKRLLTFGLKQQDIAAKVGRSPAHISKRLSLLELPKEVHDLVIAGKLHIADALELTPYVKDAEVIEETLKHLKESIRNGWGFRVDDHARGAKRRIENARKRKAAIEQLTADKVSIVKGDPWNLTRLGKGYNQIPMTPAAHSKSPCHAAFVADDGAIEYVCTKPANHKASEDKAVAKAAKALTGGGRGGAETANKAPAKKAAESRERNKVLRIREPLRTAELKRVLAARQKREDVLDFILRQLLQLLVHSDYEVGERAAAILEIPMGKKSHTYDRANPEFAAYLSGGNDRLFKLAYAVALASGEHPFQKLLAQGYFDEEHSANAARYLDHLKANGYKADKVEVAQLTPVNKYRWRPPFDKAKGKEKS